VGVRLIDVAEEGVEVLLPRRSGAVLEAEASLPEGPGGVARLLQHLGDGRVLGKDWPLAVRAGSGMAGVPMALTPDGRWLFRGGREPDLSLHDLSGPEPRLEWKVDDVETDYMPGSIDVTPDGQILALATQNHNEIDPLRMFRRTSKGLAPMAFPNIPAKEVRISPSGKLLAVSGERVSLVDLTSATPTVRTTIDLDGAESGEPDLLFTPDARRLVMRYRKAVTTWDTATGQKLGECILPRAPSAVALAPDGRHMAVGFSNGTILVFGLRPR
jgi:WD40 repeat protein